jgi:RRXRR protein
MQKQKNYKNVRTQILILNNSVEPLNTMSSGNTGLSSSCNLEGCKTTLEKAVISRIPVQSKSGKPLMPCKPTKARKLLRGGKAIKGWSKLGLFYIQLCFDPESEPNKNQTVVLGLDPGSKFDGYTVTSKTVNVTGMSELPSGIAEKLETRRTMRRARRFRNCPRRENRFDNRNKDGFIAPSQKAKVDFRLKIVTELLKLFPVTDFVVEDVRFNHYKKKWGKHFSTVEIGKAFVYEELKKLGKLTLIDGIETSIRRKELGLKKGSKKNKREPESHATDAIALASFAKPLDSVAVPLFLIWKRYQNSRRQLHRLEPDKKGIRTRYGGSDSLNGFKKNDVVMYQGELARIGGYMGNRLSLHEFDLNNKRFTQRGNPIECTKLFNQKLMYEEPQWAGIRSSPGSKPEVSATPAPHGVL